MRHAIKHQVGGDAIDKAASVLRDAKLAAIKAQFAETRNPEKNRLLNKWKEMSVGEIVALYSKGIDTQ